MELGFGLTQYIPMVVYLIGMVVVLLTLFYKIEIGIFFLVPMLPLQNLLDAMIPFPGGEDFMDMLYAALMIKTVLIRSELPKATELRKSMKLIVTAICVWTFMELLRGSLYIGSDLLSLGDARFVTWKNYVMLPILYFIVVSNIKNEKQIKILLVLMSVSMLFMDRSFYSTLAGRDTSHYRDDIRSGGTFTYLGPNELAVFYAQNSIILLCLFLVDDDKRRKWFFLIVTIFNYFCAVFLYSRGGYLAILVSWMFLGFIKDRRVLIAFILFLAFWRVFTPQSVQERIDMTETEEGVDSSVEYRYEMWEKALGYFYESPVYGVGYGVIPTLRISAGHVRRSLHNGYLEIAVEQGVIGLIIFFTLYGMCIRYGWRLYREADDKFFKGFGLGFVGCVLAILAGNIFGSYWFYINVSGFFWTNLALVVRATEIAREARTKENQEGENMVLPIGEPRLRNGMHSTTQGRSAKSLQEPASGKRRVGSGV
jgi:O-antigen ligase